MVPTPDGRSPAQEVFQRLWQVHRTLQQVYQRQMDNDGMNIHQLATLLHLHEQGGATPGRLSEVLGVTRASVSGVLNRLEEQQLVYRTTDPVDKRVVRVALTEKGRGLARDRHERFAAAQDAILDDWSETELRELAQLLGRFGERLASALERPPLPPPMVAGPA